MPLEWPSLGKEQPCKYCQSTDNEYSYRVRDRTSTMPESYLRRLEAGLKHAKERNKIPKTHAVNSSEARTPAPVDTSVKNSSAKKIYAEA